MKVKLDVVTTFDNGADDVFDRSYTPYQGWHRVDEEYCLQVEPVEDVQLVGDPDSASVGHAFDRTSVVLLAGIATAAHRKARLVFRVDGDEQLRHGSRPCPVSGTEAEAHR